MRDRESLRVCMRKRVKERERERESARESEMFTLKSNSGERKDESFLEQRSAKKYGGSVLDSSRGADWFWRGLVYTRSLRVLARGYRWIDNISIDRPLLVN